MVTPMEKIGLERIVGMLLGGYYINPLFSGLLALVFTSLKYLAQKYYPEVEISRSYPAKTPAIL